MLPGLAKSSTPVGELKYNVSGRMSLPGKATATAQLTTPVRASGQSGLGTMPASAKSDISNVRPVGPAVAAYSGQPADLQPTTLVTPEKQPGAGLARVTTPTSVTAPATRPVERVALGVTPPSATLVTDAALAEYRGLPIPASRMLARLPEAGTGRVSADGRITKPGTEIAAVPIHMAKMHDIKIVFDGEVLSLRATPETRNGISLAPLREIFEQTDGVLYWFPVEKQVHAVNKGVDVKMKIGDPKCTVNGEDRVLQVAPFIKRGRTMVPLQFIADVLDVNIAVNSSTGDIMISSNQQ
jgi:hypothetical protein